MGCRIRRRLSTLLALSLLAAACSGDGDAESGGLGRLVDRVTSSSTGDTEPGSSGSVDWSETEGSWQRGTLEVPLDHADPEGEVIELALVRRPAEGPSPHLGPLLLNPGGPGASGIELALLAELLFPAEVLESFDIVGFDPRGVEASAPVMCGDDEFLDEYTAFDPVPDSPEETAAAEALIVEFAENCEDESGELLPHVSTIDTARDMDLIRAALGADRINYLGFSYGTLLGATYLELFPDKVRAAVLDGAYSRSLSAVEMAEGQAVGFERSIDAFLEWCRSRSCDLAASGEPEAQLMGLLDRIDRRPLATDGERELTVGLAWTGVIMAMYSPALWPVLDDALVQARNGDGSRLLGLADQYNDRGPDGEYSNQTFAFTAINCVDEPAVDEATEEEMVEQVLAAAPRVGPLFVELPSPCEHWPVEADPPTHPFSSPDAPPVLVVATTGDPATPYEWGVRLADELETATLLSVEGDTHTAYAEGIPCVDDAVEAYLLELEVPEEGARC